MVLVSEISKVYLTREITVTARVVDMSYDTAKHRVYLTVADASGHVLVEVTQSTSQAIFVGSILSIHGTVMLLVDRVLVSATDINKLQAVEDGYPKLAEIPAPASADLPLFEGERWVKPPEERMKNMEQIHSAVFKREKNSMVIICGVALCCLAFLPIPIISCLFCVSGVATMLMGLLVEKTTVTSFEKTLLSQNDIVPSAVLSYSREIS